MEEWVRASVAIRLLSKSQGLSLERASSLLEERAALGHLVAKAGLRIETTETRGVDATAEYVNEEVPRWAWQARRTRHASSLFDWQTDSYTAWTIPRPDNKCQAFKSVELIGIEFRAADIAELTGSAILSIASEDKLVAPSLERPKSDNRGGRKPHEGWPLFVAELCAHIHDNGIPEGIGTEGADALIEAVQTALMKRGIENAPSRATVQSAVGATLLRLRESS